MGGVYMDTGATFVPVQVHSNSCQCKSTLIPSQGSVFCFHGTTTKCHAGTSHTGMSSPPLFGARISLRLEILQRYNVNLKWPLILVWNWSAGWLECVVPKVIHNFPTEGIPVKLHIFHILNFLAFENPPRPRNFQSLPWGEDGYFLELHNG